MDFIEGLPKSQGKDTIFVVVDRLSKYAHFMLLSHPYTAEKVAQVFFDQVFRLHEWWYNTNFHSSAQSTPFQIVYGQSPFVHIPYVLGDSQVAAVDRSLAVREECIKLLQFHLKRAQVRMKNQADKGRSDKQFLVGDAVYMKLQPYRQNSVAYRTFAKLAPEYFGHFLILDKVGEVAYKLKLPDHSKIHPVFHVGF
ncbi:hypothetical protein RND81_03G006800 [Saponaria officinalis]|uniref:Tf2-1-like SH3-like domain-containing protein n=1 Tax=Saponaria officinalis TaxID=3572 RepID=A0AAW1M0L0_SAPOF